MIRKHRDQRKKHKLMQYNVARISAEKLSLGLFLSAAVATENFLRME